MGKVYRQEQLMEARGYVTPRRAAELCGRDLSRVYAWIKKGALPTIRCGNRQYIARKALEAFMPVAKAAG